STSISIIKLLRTIPLDPHSTNTLRLPSSNVRPPQIPPIRTRPRGGRRHNHHSRKLRQHNPPPPPPIRTPPHPLSNHTPRLQNLSPQRRPRRRRTNNTIQTTRFSNKRKTS